MKSIYYLTCLLMVLGCNAQNTTNNTATSESETAMKYNPLTEEEKRVILSKGTEYPGTSEFTDSKETGTYICKQCNQPLYTSDTKFNSHCGWPSFDDEIDGAVDRVPDADGRRTEIICSNCKGHLGHVFLGEGFTPKNTRHCVNGISMNFIPGGEALPQVITSNANTANLDTATFGAGCFWCVEAMFEMLKGVERVESGYAGGKIKNPTYKMVCAGGTGSVEVAQITFDPTIITYEKLVDILFHVHDPTTLNRQGNDVGEQYRSVIYYHSEEQKRIAEKVKREIDGSDLWEDPIVTTIEPIHNYSTAEDYHQNYFKYNANSNPYCSAVVAPKVKKFQLKYKELIK
jgi:peptide methionine sulfoxide reductase msrA/msrB